MDKIKDNACSAEVAIRTTMIGAIERVERVFGHLWAHEKQDGDPTITEEQEQLYDLFMELREEILDFGNKQICRVKGIKWEKKK
jgi:hypothetical protein